MLAETYLALAGTAFTGIALAVTIYKTSGQTSFLYANARVVSRTTYIADEGKLDNLIDSKTLPEFINKLKDTEYYPYLDTVNKESITELNMALEKSHINSILEVGSVAPKKFRKFAYAYLNMYESKLVKTFFRSRFSSVPISNTLIEPIGAINPVLLAHLQNTKTVADMKLVLGNTEYKELFDKDHKSIEEFDLQVEKKVMKNITKVIDELKVYDAKALKSIFDTKKEVQNILTLLKFRIRNIDKKSQYELVQLNNVDTQKIIDSPDLASFVHNFESTEYFGALKKALEEYETRGTYYSFEKELLRHFYEKVKSNDLSHVIGPYPIISYITKKEREQKNLLIIAKGIVSDMRKEEIKRMLI